MTIDIRDATLDALNPLNSDDVVLADEVRNVVSDMISQERSRRERSREIAMSDADEREYAKAQIARVLSEKRSRQLREGVPQTPADTDALIRKHVLSLLFGHGALEPLLDDPTIRDIELIGHTDVWVLDKTGHRRQLPQIFKSDDELVAWVRHRATYSADRPWDPSHPSVEIELDGGHRLTGLLGATLSPSVTIRLLRMHDVSLDDLATLGAFDPSAKEFFKALVKSKQNTIIAGETGSGKTVFLRALAAEFGETERIITVEHFRELGLHRLKRHRCVVTIAEISPNAMGRGGFSVEDGVRASRRQKPERLIVGECVGEEIYALLDAMTQGNRGCMTTIHTKSASATADRVALYARAAGIERSEALANFSQGVDFVVHLEVVPKPGGGTHHRVSSVNEIVGYRDGQVIQNRVWEIPEGGSVIAPAAGLSSQRQQEFERVGWSGSETKVVI